MHINGTLTFETKAQFTKYFNKDWKATLRSHGMTSKQYDPHGTKKPAAFDELLLGMIKNDSCDIAANAISWAKTTYGKNKIAAILSGS